MTGYPDAALGGRLEFQLGGTWTDMTPYTTPDGSAEVTIESGRQDGAQQASPASLPVTLDNSSGDLSPRNAMSPYYGLLKRGTPARYSVASPYGNYLRLDGTGSYACPSAAALNVAGVLDVRIEMDCDGWLSPGINIPVITKYGAAGNRSWYIELISSGAVRFWRSVDGTNLSLTDSTAPLPAGHLALRVVYDPAGTVTYYTAQDMNSAWTQLGSAVAIAGGTLFASTVSIGMVTSGGFAGKVFRIQVRNGTTVVASPDFTTAAAGAAGVTDAQGNVWTPAGTTAVSDRDYRLHGELSSIVPSASRPAVMRTSAVVSGLLSRLQQGEAPPVDSPMKRALSTRPGTLKPVAYWPCEDSSGAQGLASGLGGPAMGWDMAPQLAAGTAFASSAPLPVLNGSGWVGRVPPYASSGQIITRFCADLQTPPSTSALACLVRVNGTGAVAGLGLYVDAARNILLSGFGPTGAALFSSVFVANLFAGTYWFSLEMRPSGGNVQCTVVFLQPGATTAYTGGGVQTVAGSVGVAQYVAVNSNNILTDTSVGHISVQSDWETMYNLQPALDSYAGELAANRFMRVCGEQGVSARVYGPPALTPAMGPQAIDTAWSLLQECETADQGLIYEDRESVSLGLRTLHSMCAQDPVVTLSYAAANFPGSAQAAEDVQNFTNDWTVTRPGGSSARAVLDDGSATSISGAGKFQNTAQANLEFDGQLPDAAGWRLNVSAADEPRYRTIGADYGTPGAPVAGMSRLRPGDLFAVDSPPAALQTDGIRQIMLGASETFGPGRAPVWNSAPAAPYDTAVLDDPVHGRADTDGSSLAAAAAAGTPPAAWGGMPGWAGWGSTQATTSVDAGGNLVITAVTGSGGFWQAFGPGRPVTAGQTVAVTAVITAAQALSSVAVGIHLGGGSDTFTTSAPVAVAAGQTVILCVTATAAAGQTTWGAYVVDSQNSPAGSAMTVAGVYGGVAGTLSVATTGPSGATWTTLAADMPFDVRCGGEQVTVAKVTGSTSPQAFTVIRAVNGVARAQPAGTDVRLWTPAILAVM